MQELIDELKRMLAQPLPGIEAQYGMAPKGRERISIETLDPAQIKESAVVILIFRRQGEFYIPLIERPSYAGVHSGQVSLPGGRRDPEDESLEHTALRECFEEIGINEEVEVLGQLTALYIPVSNYLVTPFVAVCRRDDPAFKLHEREVNELLCLPLSCLVDESRVEAGKVDLSSGGTLISPYINLQGRKVWGATAMILNELKEILRKAGKSPS